MTTIINLWAGPGAGKSTTAAEVFAKMKAAGLSVELVREYVKNWAWRGEKIGEWDDVYLVAKQLRAESALYGKVDYIITDSPLQLPVVYERKYNPGRQTIWNLCMDLRARQLASGLKVVDVRLLRSKPYVNAGRYETEGQARSIDELCSLTLMDLNPEYVCAHDAAGVLNAAGVVL